MHVETTQIAAACLGIGTIIKCSLNVYSRSDFRLLALVIRRTCIKEAVYLCPTAY